MKHYILLIMLALCMAVAQAQPRQHDGGPRPPRPPFNPVQFEKDLEQFIVTEAGLTPAESSKFFPLYREMRKKQMVFFNEMQRDRFVDVSNDRECERVIRESDQRDLDLKRLQREYHTKFLKIMSPSKVFKVIRAEEKFHRNIFKKMARRDGKNFGRSAGRHW